MLNNMGKKIMAILRKLFFLDWPYDNELPHEKTSNVAVYQEKAQICLGISSVRSLVFKLAWAFS